MQLSILKSIIIAATVGFMIGMQRAIYHLKHNEKSFAGSRTFSIIAITGFSAGLLETKIHGIIFIAGIATALIILAAYYFKITTGQSSKTVLDLGSTTHFTALLTFLLGMMTATGLEKYAIVMTILIVALLEIKPTLKRFESRITSADVNAAVLLLAMTFIILPILPNKFIGPYQLFNPYKTWLMAVLISALSFVGYVAIKSFGHKKGLFLTGALGGLISSTAVSVTMSKLARNRAEIMDHAAGAIAMACSFMFLRVLVLVSIVNQDLISPLLLPFSGAALAGFIYTYALFKKTSPLEDMKVSDDIAKNPLQLSEALKFGVFFGIVYGMTSFLQTTYGNAGTYIMSVISGLTDVDAITLSLAELAKMGRLHDLVSANGIVIASAVNTVIKLVIAWTVGGTTLGKRLLKFFLLSLGVMSIYLFITMTN